MVSGLALYRAWRPWAWALAWGQIGSLASSQTAPYSTSAAGPGEAFVRDLAIVGVVFFVLVWVVAFFPHQFLLSQPALGLTLAMSIIRRSPP
ncbi:MAG: hypothetical protein IPO60_18310 [Flavobacteriales bacterium]|nr:hypothetical protein [Flavobacteriales bacterium]